MATRSDRKRITKWSQRDRNSSLGSFWCWILLPFFTSVIRSNSKFGNLEVSNPASCSSYSANWSLFGGYLKSFYAETWVHSKRQTKCIFRGYLSAFHAAKWKQPTWLPACILCGPWVHSKRLPECLFSQLSNTMHSPNIIVLVVEKSVPVLAN